LPRHVVMLLSLEMTRNPSTAIGRLLNRDHSTILAGRKSALSRVETDPTYAAQVESCRALLIHRPSWKAEAARSIRENGLHASQEA
jgi:hypothetical protein